MRKGNEKIVDPFDRQFNPADRVADFVISSVGEIGSMGTRNPVSSGLVMKLLPTRIVVVHRLEPTAVAIYE